MKSYLRYRAAGEGQDVEVAWLLVGSHNLSKAGELGRRAACSVNQKPCSRVQQSPKAPGSFTPAVVLTSPCLAPALQPGGRCRSRAASL